MYSKIDLLVCTMSLLPSQIKALFNCSWITRTKFEKIEKLVVWSGMYQGDLLSCQVLFPLNYLTVPDDLGISALIRKSLGGIRGSVNMLKVVKLGSQHEQQISNQA